MAPTMVVAYTFNLKFDIICNGTGTSDEYCRWGPEIWKPSSGHVLSCQDRGGGNTAEDDISQGVLNIL